MKSYQIIIPILSLFFLLNCSENNISEPEIYGEVFVIDKLDVQIIYDNTPGFKYPLMRHEISTETHLIENGTISAYQYECVNAETKIGVSIDYFKIFDSGYRFNRSMIGWNHNMIDENTVLPYTLLYYADLENSNATYIHESNAKVKYMNEGIRPEDASIQLTGPENRNYYPNFSNDGTWIYYKSSHDKKSIIRTDKSGSNYQEIIDFSNLPYTSDPGNYVLTNNNKLLYILRHQNEYSNIVLLDLHSMQSEEFNSREYLWGTEPIIIPNTTKILNKQDPNYVDIPRDRLLIYDYQTQEVDTLLKGIDIYIDDYTVNPITHKIYINTSYEGIIEYDLKSDEYSTFISSEDFEVFKFFPNGIDYAYIKKDDNNYSNIFVYQNSSEKQLTLYPGDVYGFSISPNGEQIVFSANRRGETQSRLINL